jgi:hypothetical protein
MVKIKNKTYQPLPLVIDGKTFIVPERTAQEVPKITKQMLALKSKGMLQIISK